MAMNLKNNGFGAALNLKPDFLRKKTVGLLSYAARLIVLLSIGFIIIYPLFYMIVCSVQSADSFYDSTRVWIPTEFAVKENYTAAFNAMEYGKSFLSTLKYAIVSALLEVASCAFIAYGFARFNFREKKIYTFFLFITILIPDMILLIPRMVNFSHLDFLGLFGLFNKLTGVDLRINVLDSPWVFWLPSLFGTGLRSGVIIYIYIQFFKGLPHELEEAAYVDGANHFRTFFSIALPSSGVVILTATVFSLIWHWNDYLLSGMYLTKDYPLAMQLNMLTETIMLKYDISVDSSNPQTMAYLMAGCVLFVTPMLAVYMVLQKGFIESIDRVGITG